MTPQELVTALQMRGFAAYTDSKSSQDVLIWMPDGQEFVADLQGTLLIDPGTDFRTPEELRDLAARGAALQAIIARILKGE